MRRHISASPAGIVLETASEMARQMSLPTALRSATEYLRLTLMMVVAGCVAACAAPDRGQCLESRTVTNYVPLEVFTGGPNAYSHEYFPYDEQKCVRWEYPEGKPPS
jgi:hypothetical protein